MALSVTGGPTWVADHHCVAGGRVDLRLVEDAPILLGERATVHHAQHRVRALALRHHQPAVHRVAVRRGRGQLLDRAQSLVPQGLRVVGQHARAVLAEHDDVAGALRRRHHRDHHRTVRGERAHHGPVRVEHPQALQRRHVGTD